MKLEWVGNMENKIKYFSLFSLLFITLASCNKYSEISIISNLQEGDSISVAFYSNKEERYIQVNGVTVTSEDASRSRVDISLLNSPFPFRLAIFYRNFHPISDSALPPHLPHRHPPFSRHLYYHQNSPFRYT